MSQIPPKHIYDPQIVTTADGSHSVYVAGLDEHYHSHHGAIQEARHVFIDAGLLGLSAKMVGEIRILEVGFGTGLNALLSAAFAENARQKIAYTGIEQFPLSAAFCAKLNYATEIPGTAALFKKIHEVDWEGFHPVSGNFDLRKIAANFHSWSAEGEEFDLIYFDAFGFRAQQDLWSTEVFKECFNILAPGGILTTYASKGEVRRSMCEVGFEVEKLPGPPGKREMMRAQKPLA